MSEQHHEPVPLPFYFKKPNKPPENNQCNNETTSENANLNYKLQNAKTEFNDCHHQEPPLDAPYVPNIRQSILFDRLPKAREVSATTNGSSQNKKSPEKTI